MSDELPMPATAQAGAVRSMLLEDQSGRPFAEKLKDIKTQYSQLGEGVKIVQKEGASPKAAGSGSAPLPKLNLTDLA